MIFAWDSINCEHIAKHAVTPREAEEAISGARRPYPRLVADGKLIVRGQTSAGRYLQVIFVLKSPYEVPYELIDGGLARWKQARRRKSYGSFMPWN
jgi:hypothetical protein